MVAPNIAEIFLVLVHLLREDTFLLFRYRRVRRQRVKLYLQISVAVRRRDDLRRDLQLFRRLYGTVHVHTGWSNVTHRNTDRVAAPQRSTFPALRLSPVTDHAEVFARRADLLAEITGRIAPAAPQYDTGATGAVFLLMGSRNVIAVEKPLDTLLRTIEARPGQE